MDQGAVTSRFVDFTAVLRVYNVEILGSRLQCGVGVLGGSLLNILKDLVFGKLSRFLRRFLMRRFTLENVY